MCKPHAGLVAEEISPRSLTTGTVVAPAGGIGSWFDRFRRGAAETKSPKAVNMLTIRRILCPVDFSRFSHHALEEAVAVAREFSAEVSVLHASAVAPVTSRAPIGAPLVLEPARLTSQERGALTAQLREFAGDVEATGLQITAALDEQEPVAAIVDRATQWPADLIVLGTHGRSGFERLLLGSVAEKVLRKAPCPVLTVPPRVTGPARALTVSRILCAIDFSQASLRALEYAASFAAVEGPGVVAMNVVELFAESGGVRDELVLDTPSFRAALIKTAQERLHTAIPEALRVRCPIAETVTTGRAYREILRVATVEEAGLIVLGVRGRATADLLFFGSTAQHVVRQAGCPVLTVRA
jgi:nucleotide-binding universal stress UspA family protein